MLLGVGNVSLDALDQASGDTAFKASLFVAVSPYSGLMHDDCW